MSLELVRIHSIDDLRAVAPAWDDLWQRSRVTLPTMRAEPLAQWLERFSSSKAFHCLAVKDRGQLVAALPLVARNLGRTIRVGSLPANIWMSSGDLLVDENMGGTAVFDQLVVGLCQSPWPLIWFDEVVLSSVRCSRLLDASVRAGLDTALEEQYRVGLINPGNNWMQYERSRSKSHRRRITKSLNRLRRTGDVQLRVYDQPEADELNELLQRAFQIEDRSWKGVHGTSVLRSPGMFDYLTRQAEYLSSHQHFQLSLLECDKTPIAFAYGWRAKGTYHSYKIGYDQAFSSFSPGHLLRYFLLQRLADDSPLRTFDCLGPLSDATSKWTTDNYVVGRLVLAPHRQLGRLLLRMYKGWWPRVRQLRGWARNDSLGGRQQQP